MLRVTQPPDVVEELVEEAMTDVGVQSSDVRRDEQGRIVGTKSNLTATAEIVVDVGTPPDQTDVCYVSVAGRYVGGSQVPSILGWQPSPKVATEFREQLWALADDDLRPI